MSLHVSPSAIKTDAAAIGEKVNYGSDHVFKNRKNVCVGSVDADLRTKSNARHVENEPQHCHVCNQQPQPIVENARKRSRHFHRSLGSVSHDHAIRRACVQTDHVVPVSRQSAVDGDPTRSEVSACGGAKGGTR